MEKAETLRQYYQLTNREIPADLLCPTSVTSHFNVWNRVNCSLTLPFLRRDYYKICLIDDHAILHTEGGNIEIDHPCIFFSNPAIKYGWQTLAENQKGYVCLFNEPYLSGELKNALKKLYALFGDSIYPFIFLDRKEFDLFMFYFKRMHEEYNSNFEYKKEVIQNLLRLVTYLGIQAQLAHFPPLPHTASQDRIVLGFMALLDSQFPVDSPGNPIAYRTPAHFAGILHVHVNHLNHCLKTQTAKSTTQIINERIASEAIDLLENTDWSITEIGESLGFEYPQHFTHFLKKQTRHNPKHYRSPPMGKNI